MEVVVARYHENVDWTRQIQTASITIYNKGYDAPCGFNMIQLPNIGREGHTYYHHIVSRYDSLAEYTAFLQGNPFDHSPHLLQNIYQQDQQQQFRYLSENIYQTNLAGCPYHHHLPLRDIYERLFGERHDNMSITFGAGAQFIVHRDLILKRPKSFYQGIVDLLSHSSNPIEGFVIERFHGKILNAD